MFRSSLFPLILSLELLLVPETKNYITHHLVSASKVEKNLLPVVV